MDRPNILLITADQLRKDALGCYGNPVIRTPNIDALASQGTRFDRCFCASPACAPSRASIVTGRYPSVHGLMENGSRLSPNEVTLMECLRRAGYSTYGAGKMHFVPQWKSPVPADELMISVDFTDAVNPQPQPWEFPYYGFEKAMITEDHRVGPYAQYLRSLGLDPWEDPHSFTYPQSICKQSIYPKERHQTAWIGDCSLEYIDGHDAGKPFFLWTSFVHPHHPFNPPAPYDSMYDASQMPDPVRDQSEIERWPQLYRDIFNATEGGHEAIGMKNMTDVQWKQIKAFYYGMISFIDEQVGRIIQRLKERNLFDKTVVLFTADHGELMGDHGLLFKGAPFDCVTNVPLVIAHPQEQTRSSAQSSIVQLVDLMPTLLNIAGVAIPETVQGRRIQRDTGRDAALIESPDQVRTVWTPEARLTWHGPGKVGELYDHRSDPNALRNLWDNPSAAALQRQMMDRLVQLMAKNMNPASPRVCLC